MNHAETERDEFYKNARYDLPGPLVGVRVLEITTTWAGPRCGCILADYGADVIRIELAQVPDISRMLPPHLPGTNPPDGFLHASANKNKRSIALDIRKPEGRSVFMRMLPNFDIVLENFKKGTMASWGCSYTDCCKIVPNIIYISITGFGQFGPYSERPGYDPAAQAYSGFMWLNRENENDTPMRAPTFLADELAGLHGALSAVAAIRHRERTGEGQHIDVSLLDATMDSSTGLLVQAAAGIEPTIIGNPMPFAAPTGIFKCKDGYVYAGVLLDTHWKVMAKMIGRPELADDPRYSNFLGRIMQREEVDKILGEWCEKHTREEIVEACQTHQIAVASVCSAMEAVNDPHVQARAAFSPVKTVDGTELRLNSPAPKMSRTPLRNRAAAPIVGQHTDEILKAMGFSEAERAKLRETGVIQ
ncbi:MAG TPA: CoA transferase [Candidatus Hydrogenedentes bacterium]|nr:CoA transferase [Candidatus Hydrogenedentota bacterium]